MKCSNCGKEGVSLAGALHKEVGYVELCRECYKDAYKKNLLVSGSGSGGGGSCAGSCRSCHGCP